MSPKWPILCRVGRKNRNSISQSADGERIWNTAWKWTLVEWWVHVNAFCFVISSFHHRHHQQQQQHPRVTDAVVRSHHTTNSMHLHCEQLSSYLLLTDLSVMPSVLWRCWLGGRKGIRPVKNWVVGCWHGYLSGARCRLVYGPVDATATHCLLLQ